jgi:hypothetical protein
VGGAAGTGGTNETGGTAGTGGTPETGGAGGGTGDGDLDGVPDALDPAPGDATICGDEDDDGCDDCSVLGLQSSADDGYDYDADGSCEVALDYDCMNGANAPLLKIPYFDTIQ